MLQAARQKLAAMADASAQAPLTPRTTNDTPQSSGGGGGGGGLSANAPSFSLTAAVPAFVPSNPYSAQPAPQMGGYDRGGAGRAGGRGRGRGRALGAVVAVPAQAAVAAVPGPLNLAFLDICSYIA